MSDLTPTAPPGSTPHPPRPPGTARRRVVRAVSLLLLLVGLFGYWGAVEVLVRDLDSPPWWSWLWLAVPATVASWLVLLAGRVRRPAPAGRRRS